MLSALSSCDLILLLGGIAWIPAYAVQMRKNHIDRAYGFPFVALGLNLGHEARYFVLLGVDYGSLDAFDTVSLWILGAWVVLDLLLIGQTICYAHRIRCSDTPGFVFLVVLISSLGSQVLFYAVDSIDPDWTGVYAGFTVDAIMFVLILHMLRSRTSLAGISITVLRLTFMADVLLGIAFAAAGGALWFCASFLIIRITAGRGCLSRYRVLIAEATHETPHLY